MLSNRRRQAKHRHRLEQSGVRRLFRRHRQHAEHDLGAEQLRRRQRQQNWQVFDRMSKYVSIPPKASRTLSITYSDRWQENTSDPGGNIHIYIRQKPIRINTEKITISKIKKKCVRRIDEIIFKDTIVNNCECDIDALKAEHKAIQETYERLKREKLIRE